MLYLKKTHCFPPQPAGAGADDASTITDNSSTTWKTIVSYTLFLGVIKENQVLKFLNYKMFTNINKIKDVLSKLKRKNKHPI